VEFWTKKLTGHASLSSRIPKTNWTVRRADWNNFHVSCNYDRILNILLDSLQHAGDDAKQVSR